MSNLSDTIDDLSLLISRAEESVKDRTFDDLTANSEAYDALTYRLAMIGETCKKLSDEVRNRYPHLPWREMATFRNFASHDYFGVDAHLVWQAATSLEPVKAMVREETSRLEAERERRERAARERGDDRGRQGLRDGVRNLSDDDHAVI